VALVARPNDSPRSITGLGVLLVLAAAAAYANSWGVPFLFDDIPSVFENPTIRQLWPLSTPLSPPNGFGFTVSGRPLVNLSLAINWAVGGADVTGYHVFNFAIHALAGLTLFGLARRTLRRPVLAGTFGGWALPLAGAMALGWMLHPLQTEAVTYIIQRAESMMALFYLLTLYGFARAADATERSVQRRWQGVTLAACALGMLCKEVMVSAPLAVLLYDRTFVAGNFRAAWRARRGFYGALALTWLPLAWLIVATGGDRGGTFTLTLAACWQQWLTQCEALTRYLWLAFWPSPLIFEYGIPPPLTVADVGLQALLVLALLGATLWALWRRPVAGFLGAMFFLILAPTSLMPAVTQVIVEHRMYLPLAAVVALTAGGCVRWWGGRGLVAWTMLALAGGGLTFLRNRDYASDLTLWKDTVDKRPTSALAQSNLASAYYARGELAAAVRHNEASLELNPKSAQVHFNLGLAFDRLGRTEEAATQYQDAVAILPYFAQAHSKLGLALVKLHRVPEAVEHLAEALSYIPDYAEAHYGLGLAAAETERWTGAVGYYEKALQLSPDYAAAESNLGVALSRLGRSADAERHLRRALRLEPSLAEAHFNLGLVLAAQGKAAAAREQYAEAVRLAPDTAEAQLNLGVAEAQAEKWDEALAALRAAVRLRPDLAEAHANLGIVLAELGRTEEAVASYEEALRLRPDYAVAHYNLGNALLRLQRWSEAKRHFAEAARLAPEMKAAREMEARLQAMP
jgi:tetratricopeptide (TPR) repeat protein